MTRRVLLCIAGLLILAAPASGEDIHRRKQEVDQRLSSLNSKLAYAKSREAVLTQEITIVDGKIAGLEDDVRRARAQLDSLEVQLAFLHVGIVTTDTVLVHDRLHRRVRRGRWR